MNNRNNTKWQPFEAVVSGNKLINNIINEKRKVKMPILSEDQKEELQEGITRAFNNQDIVTIKFYRNGLIYKIKGKITKIDVISQKITINEHFFLFFSQIIQLF